MSNSMSNLFLGGSKLITSWQGAGDPDRDFQEKIFGLKYEDQPLYVFWNPCISYDTLFRLTVR